MEVDFCGVLSLTCALGARRCPSPPQQQRAEVVDVNRPPAYVLKFISGKYQGGEFYIENGQEVIIGRSSDLDMVLVEDMVSRRHSRISFEAEELYIEDLGSTNGTFVNGEKISRKKLKVGDRILVGTSIIKLVAGTEASSATSSTPEPVRREGGSGGSFNASTTQTFHTRGSTATMTGSISGLIEEVPLPDLLQLFSTSKKSGVLLLRAEREGRIYLREGRVYYAVIDNNFETPPDKSFYRLLAWSKGTFILEQPTGERFDNELDASTEALMMEGMRQLDEVQNLGGQVPGFEDNLYIDQPLIPPLRSLTPELLDTLQLIHNYGNVEAILNSSLASDLETMQDIVYLIKNEYVRVM